MLSYEINSSLSSTFCKKCYIPYALYALLNAETTSLQSRHVEVDS